MARLPRRGCSRCLRGVRGPQAAVSQVLARAYAPAVAAGVRLVSGPAEVKAALARLALAAGRSFAMRLWRTVLNAWVPAARTYSDRGAQ